MNDEYDRLLDSCVSNAGKFNSVIFLDIDGVLNDFDDRSADRVIIDEKMVSLLKKITEISGAEIILTSSWRIYYNNWENSEYKSVSSHFHELLEIFDKYGLTISGATEEISYDNNSRPLEIRHWLLDKPDVERFVILDDTDWNWGWLSSYVVNTRRKDSSSISGWRSGLDIENVQEALKILGCL